jgi:phage-related protein
MNTPATKPVIWMGDSLERLREFPATVQDEVGYAIYLAQIGEKHLRA